ncbi:hypothetical protein ACTFIZ_009247 [Dictyostelium cf. discoideum]
MVPDYIEHIFFYNVGPNVLTGDSIPSNVRGIHLMDGFNNRLYNEKTGESFIPKNVNQLFLHKIRCEVFKNGYIPDSINHLHMFQGSNQRLYLTPHIARYIHIHSNLNFTSNLDTMIEIFMRNGQPCMRIRSISNISLNQLIDSGVLSGCAKELLIGYSSSRELENLPREMVILFMAGGFLTLQNSAIMPTIGKIKGINVDAQREDDNIKSLFLKIFGNKYIRGEIYKYYLYKYNSKNTDKLSARRVANSINKGVPSNSEKEVISTIKCIRENNYKNREYFRHLFSHPLYNCGNACCSGIGSGGEGQQINFGDFNKWLTIILQSKNLVALKMFILVFSLESTRVKNIILKLIKENKYLVNNSKYDLEFNLNINQYFHGTTGDEDLCTEKIIINEALFRNNFPSLKNYISRFTNKIKENKAKSGGRSLYGSSFERDFIKTVLLTGNVLLIEEVFMSNVIDAQRNCEVIFRSISSQIIMDLVFKYYKDLLFFENNFNYIYLNNEDLTKHYENLMDKSNRKALVNSFDDMDRKLKSSNKQSIFTFFIIATSNPRVYFISDEIKKSYLENIHLVSDYETLIRMLQALKIHK